MFTLIGFTQSQDTAGNLTKVNAMLDPHVSVQNNAVVVPALNQIVCVFASGVTISRAQLRSPSLRKIVNYEISSVNFASAQPNSPVNFVDLGDSAIALDKDEQLEAYVAETAAGAEQEYVLVWLADGPLKAVTGNIMTLRVTSATTLAANAWTNGALTFDQTLPVGNYAIVGARFNSTGLIAFRFTFVGGIWRPGGLGVHALNGLDNRRQRRGEWGEWGQFAFNTPPTVDFLSISADTSETGELDLIKLG